MGQMTFCHPAKSDEALKERYNISATYWINCWLVHAHTYVHVAVKML